MKNVLLAISLLSSLSSLASTTIMMTSADYSTVATLTAGETPLRGTFTNETERYGKCEGTFAIMPGRDTVTVNVSFPVGICNVQGMDITMTSQDFGNFMNGMEVPVMFKQLQFYMGERPAMLKIIARQ